MGLSTVMAHAWPLAPVLLHSLGDISYGAWFMKKNKVKFYGAPEWGRANGIAKSEKGSWCLRTGDWGFF